MDFKPDFYKDRQSRPHFARCLATHTETGEKLVVYWKLGVMVYRARPLASFMERFTIFGSKEPIVPPLSSITPVTLETNVEPGLYRHCKGGLYRVMDLATHTETEKKLVIYCAVTVEHTWPSLEGEYWKLYWARPFKMFKDGRFTWLDPTKPLQEFST